MLKSATGTNEVKIAAPLDVLSVDDCYFYHVVDLPGHGVIDTLSSWDLRGRFSDYLGGFDVKGKSLLDVGAASGFISFEAERMGAAEVYGFDVDSAERFNLVPYSEIPSESPRWFYEKLLRSYWFSHKAHGSSAKMIYGDIYKMADQVPQVDVVLLAQILVHLERPLQAIAQAALAAKETLIIVDGSFEDERPLAVFIGGDGAYFNWYHHSVGFYRKFLPIVGFELISANKNTYRTSHPHVDSNQEVWTFIAERRATKEAAWDSQGLLQGQSTP
jgi:Ribosomal protein L11 methyltransferase (PrmA)